MTRHLSISLASLAFAIMVPSGIATAQTTGQTTGQTAAPAAATASNPMAAEDARLTAFLDAEFAEYLKMQPQLATRWASRKAATSGTTSAMPPRRHSWSGGRKASHG